MPRPLTSHRPVNIELIFHGQSSEKERQEFRDLANDTIGDYEWDEIDDDETQGLSSTNTKNMAIVLRIVKLKWRDLFDGIMIPMRVYVPKHFHLEWTSNTGESGGVGDRELVESYLELFQPASDDDSLFFKGSIKTNIEGNSGDGYKIHFTRYESYKRKRSSDDGAGRLASRQRSFQAIKF